MVILTFPADSVVGVLDWDTRTKAVEPALATGDVWVPDDEPISLDVWHVEHVEWTELGHRLSGGYRPVDLGFLTQLPPDSIEVLTLKWVVPSSMRHMPHLAPGLRRLYRSNSHLDDESLAHISAMSGLTYLQSYGNTFTDDGIQQLEALQELEMLYLEEETLSAGGLTFAARLPKLKRFGLMDVPLTDDELAELRRALPSVDVG